MTREGRFVTAKKAQLGAWLAERDKVRGSVHITTCGEGPNRRTLQRTECCSKVSFPRAVRGTRMTFFTGRSDFMLGPQVGANASLEIRKEP